MPKDYYMYLQVSSLS